LPLLKFQPSYKKYRTPRFHNIGFDILLKVDLVFMAVSVWSPWWWHSTSFPT